MHRDITLYKRELRAELRAQMEGLSSAYRETSDKDICEAVRRLPEFSAAPRVFAYVSVGHEIETGGIRALARAAGKVVALPRIANRVMDFAAEDELPDEFFGIPQPARAAARLMPAAGDLVLVPALCYDGEGYRLGQGGGYYDTLLANLEAVTVGIGRAALLRRLPHEAHDMPVRILVTEQGVLRLR